MFLIRPLSRIPLRTLLTLLFCLLAAVALAMALFGALASIDQFTKAAQIAERNRVASSCLAAVKDLAFERGRTNVILRGQSVISSANRRFIDERRQGGDQALEATLAALPAVFASAGYEVADAWKNIKALREEVERDFVRPLSERNPDLPVRWMAAANNLVFRLENLLVRISPVIEADFTFTKLADLRIAALQLRNTVGSESVLLASALSAKRVPDSKVVREVLILRGRSQQLWERIEADSAILSDPAFAASLETVRRSLFIGLRPLQEEILQSWGTVVLPSFTVEQYTGMAVPALDSLIAMTASVDRAAEEYAQRQLVQARRLMAGALATCFAAVFLTVLSLYVLARRFSKPLQQILARIDALRGSDDMAPVLPGNDLLSISNALSRLENTLVELRKAQFAAEAASRAKSEFLANMSHEIRTPMNAVLGLTQLVLEGELQPAQREMLERAHASAKALLGILNDILDYSKVEAGRLELERRPLHLDHLFRSLGHLFDAEASRKGLTLSFHRAPDVPQQLIGDELRLSQILANLISNGIKFTDQGAVAVQAELAERGADAITLRLTVRDTGIGLRKEEAEHLFQVFSQADSSITRRFGGTGQGLAISQKLVRLMGGEIAVSSAPGQGASFSFTVVLGLAEAGGEVGVPPAGPDWAKLRFDGASILVVEDNAFNQQVAKEFLCRRGADVVLASHGGEAIDRVRHQHFDAILMDLHMPEMDGLEATRQIRALPGGREVPVIAMTAAVMAEDRQRCAELGMNDFVAKPMDPDELLRSLARWIAPADPAGREGA
ncbi:MAG: Signal transduction histidine-protein kinase BarA [Betaproteobacteria bacterium ADurb.Bin341]|nr:MAG: Signal transduction histidine-protein kinase BarA [Betaproteobacteria bacterium ADurb.Bin341]